MKKQSSLIKIPNSFFQHALKAAIHTICTFALLKMKYKEGVFFEIEELKKESSLVNKKESLSFILELEPSNILAKNLLYKFNNEDFLFFLRTEDEKKIYFEKIRLLRRKTKVPMEIETAKNNLFATSFDFSFPLENSYKNIFVENKLKFKIEPPSQTHTAYYELGTKTIFLSLPNSYQEVTPLYEWLTKKLPSILKHELIHYIQDELTQKIRTENSSKTIAGLPRKKLLNKKNENEDYHLNDYEFYAQASSLLFDLKKVLKDKQERKFFIEDLPSFIKKNLSLLKEDKKLLTLVARYKSLYDVFQKNDPWKLQKLQKNLLKEI